MLNCFKVVNFLLYMSSLFCIFLVGKQRGSMMRALASHQCGLGSNPGADAIYKFSLLLVLSLASRGFSPGTPVFSSPQKPTFPNSNSTGNQVDEESPCGCDTSKSLFFMCLFYFFNLVWLPQLLLTGWSMFCGCLTDLATSHFLSLLYWNRIHPHHWTFWRQNTNHT